MPKLIINGTNDEYWPVDAIKNYLDSIPGENYLLYVPNAGHDLDGGEEAIRSLSAFFGRTLAGLPYPVCRWSIKQEGRKAILQVMTSPGQMEGALLWKASSKDRDFRDEVWEKTEITTVPEKEVTVAVDLPDSGYAAFFVDLVYKAPGGGTCLKSTRMFVADSAGILE
jgi:PhoPQ-activated pathogenicity-related protein